MAIRLIETSESISALSDRLDRNYADVETLANHHVVYFDSDGQAKRPIIPYERVVLDVEVASDSTTERPPA